ncbi:MAG: hypothetical protein U9P50_03380 [Patescibacteria group bacterium]|nr:hypothetical protein [Patescibacteria group bacterium]
MKNIFILVIVIAVLGAIGWYLPKSPVDPAELEFNNSGRAKAIEGETDLWKIYEDKDIGFTIKYPHDVALGGEDGNLALDIEVIKIDDLDYPGFDKADVLKDIQVLEGGELTENSGVYWGLPLSEKVVNLGRLNGQELMVLSRFEVCNVTFERKLLFYDGDYRVVITLEETKSNIVDNLPQYFKLDEENCGDEIIWNFDKQDQFYKDLAAGKSFFTAQEWFDTFDKIIGTIELAEIEEPANYSQLIEGTWTSLDDENSIIEFKDGMKTDIYSGEEMSSDEFGFYESIPTDEDSEKKDTAKYLVVETTDGVFEYEIAELTENTLNLIYLPRGNILKYSK